VLLLHARPVGGLLGLVRRWRRQHADAGSQCASLPCRRGRSARAGSLLACVRACRPVARSWYAMPACLLAAGLRTLTPTRLFFD